MGLYRPCQAIAAVFLSAFFVGCGTSAPVADWPNPGNDKGGSRYSVADQINRGNVAKLQVAWTYKVDDADPARNTTIECTPIVHEGTLYLTTVRTKVVALDAATGQPKWTFDPYGEPYAQGGKAKWIRASGGVNRGVAYWSDGLPTGARRVILGTSDGRLISLDARTGKPDPAFGNSGIVELRKGITERDLTNEPYGMTSPPAVCNGVIVIGCSTGEGHPAAPGDPRGFDLHTGKELWRFHTVARPGEPGSETWPKNDNYWKGRGGANPWGGFTVDESAGIVFMGTGSAGADFYGADRHGANLYANCVLALDARTGQRLWHFQTTHHDLWDHDNPCPPVLCQVTRDGQKLDAVAQVTKTGFCYVLDRKTGKPLFDVNEVPVAASTVPGEQANPTQPMPVAPPPLAKLRFTEDDVTDRTPEARQAVLERLKTINYGGFADPPSERGTVNIPGFHGGATWSGASFDPSTGLLYVNTNNAPYIQGVKKLADGSYAPMGYSYFLDPDGYPAIKPPWGLVTAVDVSRGTFAWQVPLGDFPELAAKGYGKTGTENFGGTIVTAGGLVFIGGSKDAKFRAIDSGTGKTLWEFQLSAGGYATPCTYVAGERQYVVIAAGGGGKPRTPSGDTFYAFALPR
ncbi:pyrroloquinoline quinone-dependent dehydrogenase [Humisphaera borealis]|uniref:pyrroloquinoline quinone-dependent dehydrogenase n=1 Tax=Humisphaera borealis TaxID=2807512 RepID=UPI0019D1D2A0|nr:pyrroloquinoline quinone-dependent dehydrogenase [Humisphaera borealis]